jgi:hypothetical protein
MAGRKYTGFDRVGTSITPGLRQLRDVVLFLNQGKISDLGSFTIRDKRGHPGSMSVHATGRAIDFGWKTREAGENLIRFLEQNAEMLGVEMIADYFPEPWGRTWRCDRAGWKIYTRKTISGAPGGRWIHVEISPTMGRDSVKMEAAIKTALGILS